METVVLVKQFYYGDKFICLMPDKKKVCQYWKE